MPHLLQIRGLPRAEIEHLLERADAHRRALREGNPTRILEGRTVAHLFLENSTRTRNSFERAARALGAEVLTVTAQGSSVAKGETAEDSARTLDALGVRTLVVRHAFSGAPHRIAACVRASVVNAGDGTHEHPSQALLDARTLLDHFGTLEGRRVLICGDVLHSRVARSNLWCLRALGAEVLFCGPPTLIPAGLEALGAKVVDRLDDVIADVDAVMLLRVQLERQSESFFPSAKEYTRRWGLDAARAARMKPGAVVMHPGPVNRGVELASEVMDGPRSVIFEQVANGVPVRMAVLERCA